uniref:Chitin synthase n=1 Tax=Caenorhabditis tropicalis TaxID=1561998 RepID=A0A1I7ULA6_9PELO
MPIEIAKDGGISRPKILDRILRLRKVALILAYVGAFFCSQWLFDPANMEVTRISEHSLMPGLVTPKFDKSGIAIQLYRKLSNLPKTKSQQQFIMDVFSEYGLQCYTQKWKSTVAGYPMKGENVYGFVRGHRNDGAEAQLIVVQLGKSEVARRMISRMLAFIDYARDQVYWSRDFVIVFVDGEDNNATKEKAAFALDAFLLKYQKIESLNAKKSKNKIVIADEIQSQTGALIAGVVYDLSGISVKGQHIVNIQTNGLNGQQVNLDVFNGVVKIADSKHHSKVSIFGTMHRHTNPYMSFSPFTVPILAVYTQAFVSIEGIHSVMGKYGVQGLTIGLSYDYSERQTGQFIEEVSRMLNNVLERLHQSYFMYVLSDDMHFSSIGFYSITLGILICPLLISAYYECKKRWAWNPVFSYFVSHFIGFAIYFISTWIYKNIGTEIVLQYNFPFVGIEGCPGQLTPSYDTAIIFIIVTCFPIGLIYFLQNPVPDQYVPNIRVLCLTEAALILSCTGLINYGLGVLSAGSAVPIVILMTYESSQRARSLYRSGVLCLLSPLAVILLFAWNIPGIFGGLIPTKSYNSFSEVPTEIIHTMIKNDVVFGSWHFFLFCCAAWPIWTMLFACSLPYDLEVDQGDENEDEPRPKRKPKAVKQD